MIPYFGYARKDRKDEGRVPINAKLVANLITEAGADRVLAIDLHAAQIQGFFDIPVDHLYAAPVFDGALREMGADEPGGRRAGRRRHQAGARLRRRAEGASLAIVDKRRVSGHRRRRPSTSSARCEGRDVVLVDDMIATGGSISDAARIVKEKGANQVFIVASHAVLCGDAVAKLDACPAQIVLVTDTIPPKKVGPKRLVVASVAPLLARAIDRIHRSESVSSLFEQSVRDHESR